MTTQAIKKVTLFRNRNARIADDEELGKLKSMPH